MTMGAASQATRTIHWAADEPPPASPVAAYDNSTDATT
jgi:hypothetical protein